MHWTFSYTFVAVPISPVVFGKSVALGARAVVMATNGEQSFFVMSSSMDEADKELLRQIQGVDS